MPTSFWADSPTNGTKRLIDPPTLILNAQSLALQITSLDNYPFHTYAVLDSFPLRHSNREYAAVLCIDADADLLSIPGVDPIVCFIPVPGMGTYTQDQLRPSILFWRDEFWAPLYSMTPEREQIASDVYGPDILKEHTFDVLYRVEVKNMPKVDLLQISNKER